jgi:hypothetical protein
MPSMTLIIILSVVLPLLIVAITICFVLRSALGLMRESRHRRSLLRDGEPAVAEILSISDTLIASSGFAPQPARATAIVLSAVEGEPAGRLKILSLLLEVHVADRPPGSGLCRAIAREVRAGESG